jgi:hypothetical protein
MRTLSTFALEIQRGEDHEPSRVSVVLSSAAPDADGVLRLSPQFMTLDELEGSTLISAACVSKSHASVVGSPLCRLKSRSAIRERGPQRPSLTPLT